MTTKRYSACREINDRVCELVRQGWEIWKGGKHFRIRHPNGYTTTVNGSPSDKRAVQNFEAQLRRAERRGFTPERQGGYVLSIFVMLPGTILAAFAATYLFMTLWYVFIAPSAV